ncbi:MAG TPA: ATPase, T2SS/T4P/T4SS family [Candidatus Eisenbacteria bacterium]|nr:ATPase, T2SS/T4P/T4SS family [Candidatus Eisenbacteria bacterium]
MAREHKRLGDMLLEQELITRADLDAAIAEQRRTGQLLGATLVKLGRISEAALMQSLQQQLGLPVVDLEQVAVDEAAVALVREDLARRYLALPIEVEGRSTLVVAMADPLNVAAIEDLRFHCGMFVKPVLAAPSQLNEAIERSYHLDSSMGQVLANVLASGVDDLVVSAVNDDDHAEAIDTLLKESEGRPIVRLTNWVLQRAVEERASDVHIEPQDHELVVRLRVDGLLRELQRLPKWTTGAVVSRLKVLANLDIAEKRLPQDGRLRVEIGGRRVDMRISTLPLTGGEKVVIRVVDTKRGQTELDGLGMHADDLVRFKRWLDRPQGIVLVTGPTGSGKSTLLYSALRHLQHVTRNIVSVEDPVEHQLRGINQVQVDEKAKKTFPTALRAILRQDPDVIMIGEIRDFETAQIAFRASVTGHLVLSTVHTNDAASAVTRLIDLGLEPFVVASSLVGVVSMRLVRTLCPRCRESSEASGEALGRFAAGAAVDGKVTLWRSRGCPHCHETGFVGRTGIFELLEVDDATRALVHEKASDAAVRHAALEAGMHSIGEDGMRNVLDGLTTLEEVARVVYLADESARVCGSCHTVLSRDFEYCPGCGAFVGQNCTHCGRHMTDGWSFCPACGRERSTSEPAAAGGRGGEATPTAPVAPLRVTPTRRRKVS